MKIVLFSGFPLDSSYNYTVNTNDWDTLVAQYYGMTREVLYSKISTSTEFNFIDRDSVHGSCTIDLATVTKIVKTGKTAKISTDYNYAIVYDNINNEYKHYFITGWDFVSSKKVGTDYNNVYKVSFSLNLLAYFKVCETNDELPKNILVDRTHIWDNVSKYSSEGYNINPQYKERRIVPIIKDNLKADSVTTGNPLPQGRWYYIITNKQWGDNKQTVQFYGLSNLYCYCVFDGFSSDTSKQIYTSTFVKPGSLEKTTNKIGTFSSIVTLLARNKIQADSIVKIYVTVIPPISYLYSKKQENGHLTIHNVGDGDGNISNTVSGSLVEVDTDIYVTLLTLTEYDPHSYGILDYTKKTQTKKTDYYPYTKLNLYSNDTHELQPNVNIRLYTALSPTKLGFIIYYETTYIEGYNTYCELLDCSNEIPYGSTAWNDYVANNKNFYQMGVDIPRERADNATAGALFNVIGGVFSGAGQIGSGRLFSGISGMADRAVSQLGNVVTAQLNAETTIKQNQLQWDNIKNAPNKVKSLGTNIGQFSGALNDLHMYYSRLNDTEIKTLETMFYRSGHKYGTNVDTYAKLFVCTNFNYVKLGEPLFARYYGENLTDIQRDLLSEILSRGITYFEPSWFVTHGLDYPETNPYKETV